MMKSVSVSIPGRDEICVEFCIEGDSLKNVQIHVLGCIELLQKVAELKAQLQGSLHDLLPPEGWDHSSMLVREVVLKMKSQWNYPYQNQELCHCRLVETQAVDHAILSGALSVESVGRKTSAGTGCGTCRKDIQSILDYRKGRF